METTFMLKYRLFFYRNGRETEPHIGTYRYSVSYFKDKMQYVFGIFFRSKTIEVFQEYTTKGVPNEGDVDIWTSVCMNGDMC